MSYGKICQSTHRSHSHKPDQILKEFGRELRRLMGENPDSLKVIPRRIKRENWNEPVPPRIVDKIWTGNWVKFQLQARRSSQQVSIMIKDPKVVVSVEAVLNQYREVASDTSSKSCHTIALV